MIRMTMLSLALLLAGCTIRVEDQRLTREEVATAFQQRDAALSQVVSVVKTLQEEGVRKKK